MRSVQRTERGIDSILDGPSASLNSQDLNVRSAFKKSSTDKQYLSSQKQSLHLQDKFALVKSKDYIRENIEIFKKALAHNEGQAMDKYEDPRKIEKKSMQLTQQLSDLKR